MGDSNITTKWPASDAFTKTSFKECSFQWQIHNFKEITERGYFIQPVSFLLQLDGTIKFTGKIGSLNSWRIGLFRTKAVMDGIGGFSITPTLPEAYCRSTGAWPTPKGYPVKFQFTIRKTNGRDQVLSTFDHATIECDLYKQRSTMCWAIHNALPAGLHLDPHLLLVDGTLRIDVKVSFTTVETTTNFKSSMYKETLLQTSVSKLFQCIPHMFPDDAIAVPSDGKIENGLKCSKALLAARSPVLAAIIKDEPGSSTLHLKIKIPCSTLKLVLHYLRTGELQVESCVTPDSLLSLASVAVHYKISGLSDYCDEVLAGKCTLANSAFLLQASRSLGLATASKGIIQYRKFHEGCLPTTSKPLQSQQEETSSQNYISKAIVITGFHREKSSFNWALNSVTGDYETYKVVRNFNFNFNPGAEWEFEFNARRARPNLYNIQICYKLLNNGGGQTDPVVYAQLKVTMKIGNSTWTKMSDMADVTHGHPSSVMVSCGSDPTHLEYDSLALQIQLTVLTASQSRTINAGPNLGNYYSSNFRSNSRRRVIKDFENLLYSTSHSPLASDVTLVAMDGDNEFPAHWQILTARCEYFKTMFHSNLEERRTGVIKLADISASTVKVLLHYLYTGQFHDEASAGFASASSILEVARVADMCMLPELKNYCDFVLPEKCDESNVWELLEGAETFRLDYAKEMITNYIARESYPSPK